MSRTDVFGDWFVEDGLQQLMTTVPGIALFWLDGNLLRHQKE